MTEYRGPPFVQTNNMTTPSVMASSLASTLSTDFFAAGGSKIGGGSSKMSARSTPQQKEAVVLSRATATAISVARSILLTGGTHSSAISTARAAAFSILSPTHDGAAKAQRTGFLARRKCKQQAEVIASMAVVSVSSALDATTPSVYTVSDPTVVFMDQQSRSLSKGNTTESTTDDLSWHKDFTRSTADSQPPLETPPAMQQKQQQQQQQHNYCSPISTTVQATKMAINTAISPTKSENMGDSSFLTCETPTSCNVSQTSSMVTPFGYFVNKHKRDDSALPQMGRKMQLEIIQSQDRSYESEEDDSSYSGDTTHGNSTIGSTGADTQEFSTVPTDNTDITDDRVDDAEDRQHKNRKQDRRKAEERDDEEDDDSDDDVDSRRRAVLPAQLQTSNLFEDHILAALTDLCTPHNDDAVSPPSSQRHTARTFAFDKQRDDPTDDNLSDNTDSNGSSVLDSYFIANQLGTEDSIDNGWVSKKQAAAEPKSVPKDGIEQVVLRALASTILPAIGRGQVDEKLVCIESQSQPTSPRSEAKYILPGTYIRNDPISAPKMFNPRRQRSYSESRVDVTEARRHRSPMSRQVSPRRKHHHKNHEASVGWSSEFGFHNNVSRKPVEAAAASPATTMKKSNTSAWFRWKKQNGRKQVF